MSMVSFGLIMLLSAIWGASFLFIKIGVGEMGPMSLAFFRVLVGAITLAVIVGLRKERIPRSWAVWRHFAVMGFFGILLPFGAISWGTQHIASGLSAILNASMPLFTFVIAAIWGRETASWRRGIGVLIGFGGILVLTWPQLGTGLHKSLLGELAVVFAGLCYAISVVYARQNVTDQPPIVASFGQVTMGTLFFAPLMLAENTFRQPPTWRLGLAILVLGVLGTAVAYIIYYKLVRQVGATGTSLVTYIVPVFGIFWGWAILGERLTWNAFVALGLIISGMLCINGTVRLAKPSTLTFKETRS